jgi:predicted enzyme related to lactoylglutathione lyase
MRDAPVAGAIIYAADPARLSDFYCRVQGFVLMHSDDEHFRLRLSTCELVILTTAESRAVANDPSSSPTPRNQVAIKPVFYVRDLEAVRNVARELGGVLNASNQEWRFEDSIVCDGYDPEGNIFQLRQLVDQ